MINNLVAQIFGLKRQLPTGCVLTIEHAGAQDILLVTLSEDGRQKINQSIPLNNDMSASRLKSLSRDIQSFTGTDALSFSGGAA
jgi:hypothetical protein